MMGIATYAVGGGGNGGGGGGSSSSSNLSALAPPFTVDRSVPKPLVDLTEPPLNWLNTHCLGFDSVSSSNAYGFSFSSPPSHLPAMSNTNSNPVASTEAAAVATAFFYGGHTTPEPSFVEGKAYYAPYVSPTKFNFGGYTQNSSNLWDGLHSGDYDQKVKNGDGFSLKEINTAETTNFQDYNPVVGSSKGSNLIEEKAKSIIDIMSNEKHPGTSSSIPGQTSEFMPVDYSSKSVLEPTSVFPATYPVVALADQVKYRNHQTPFGTPYENSGKQQVTYSNNITSVMKSSPGLDIPVVASGVEPQKTSPFHNSEIGSGGDNIQFTCSYNFPNAKEFHPVQIPKSQRQVDSSQVTLYPERENFSFQESSSENKMKLSGDVKATEDQKEKYGFQAPHISYGFNLPVNNNGAITCSEDCSDSFDHYNPAVDSPCWKGAPVFPYLPSDTSGVVAPQLRKKIEPSSVSSPLGPLIFPLNADVSSQQPNEYPMYQDSGTLDNTFSPAPKRPSLDKLTSRVAGAEDDMKAKSYNMKQITGNGVPLSDYFNNPRQQNILLNESTDDLNFKPFLSLQIEEGELISSEKNCSMWAGVTNDGVEGCSSHVPFDVTEHVLSSPSTELNHLHGDSTVPKTRVQTLISTMHNLSELLLFHCSRELSELSRQDIGTLKTVVNNLDTCVLKNFGRASPQHESLCAQQTTQFHPEPAGLLESVTVSIPQETKAANVSDLKQSNHQNIHEESKHHAGFSMKHHICSTVGSEVVDADRVKEDDLTQAIKKVLSEHFVEEETQPQLLLYKNLWLEAEAALCSVMCRARFDRVKAEIEKCKLQKDIDFPKTTGEMECVSQSMFSPDLNRGCELVPEVKDCSSGDISVPNSPVKSANNHPEDVLARSYILKCRAANMSPTDVEEKSGTEPSSEAKKAPSRPEWNSLGLNSSSSPNDTEASVINRYHILKSRPANANMNATDVEEKSSPRLSPELSKFDKMASEAKDPPIISTWDSVVSSPSNSTDDDEASVLARFHILRNRIDHLSNLNMDVGGQLPLQLDFSCVGGGKHLPMARNPSEDEVLDIKIERPVHYELANHLKDKLTVQEFHLNVKDDHIGHSLNNTNMPENQVATLSSDWEHVLKEELPGHNP